MSCNNANISILITKHDFSNKEPMLSFRMQVYQDSKYNSTNIAIYSPPASDIDKHAKFDVV